MDIGLLRCFARSENMKILFIMNGIGSENNLPGISGGDVRWVEIAKIWQKQGHEIHVFTPQAGKDFCEKMGLNAFFHIFGVPNEYGIKTYIFRALKSFLIPKSLKSSFDIIYSSTEHWYDVIPAIKIKKNNKTVRWGAVVHWVAPLKRKGTDFLSGLLFYINQRVGYHYIKKLADVVLAVSDSTAESVREIGIAENRIFSVACGMDYDKIHVITKEVNQKEYDAIFMKRFDGTKGVFDLPEIWREVVNEKNNAKIGLIGFGTKKVIEKLERLIEFNNLQKNIEIIGPIYDFKEKFLTLAKSRLFILPSYEENWAIVIGEAMAAGLPVLCYDIKEIKPIWQDKIIWIPMGNKKQFANEINHLLSDENLRENLSKEGSDFIKKYDWKQIAENELDILLNG